MVFVMVGVPNNSCWVLKRVALSGMGIVFAVNVHVSMCENK